MREVFGCAAIFGWGNLECRAFTAPMRNHWNVTALNRRQAIARYVHGAGSPANSTVGVCPPPVLPWSGESGALG